MYILNMYASARFHERWIVPRDVPCMLHLYVDVWVRHTSPPRAWNHEITCMTMYNMEIIITDNLVWDLARAEARLPDQGLPASVW